jgi:hypothetical protein
VAADFLEQGLLWLVRSRDVVVQQGAVGTDLFVVGAALCAPKFCQTNFSVSSVCEVKTWACSCVVLFMSGLVQCAR